MYKELVTLLRKKYDKAPVVMAAADVIEELACRDARYDLLLQTVLDLFPCWVSVSDRLPEDGKKDVLCRLLDDAGDVCATVGCYDSTFKLWHLDAEWASSRHVTHWMLLPALSEDSY